MIEIRKIVNGPLEENCWLAWEKGSKEALLIDPGAEPEKIAAVLEKEGLGVALILATHAHFDHVGAVAPMKERFKAPFAMHEADLPVLERLEDTSAFYGFGTVTIPKVERWLKAGDFVEAGALKLKVIHTPGHTPGGLCFYHAESGHLFSGDTLFRLSIGRADFEGGDMEALVGGIRRELFSLPGEVKVHPGHGPDTEIEQEKRGNPFVRG